MFFCRWFIHVHPCSSGNGGILGRMPHPISDSSTANPSCVLLKYFSKLGFFYLQLKLLNMWDFSTSHQMISRTFTTFYINLTLSSFLKDQYLYQKNSNTKVSNFEPGKQLNPPNKKYSNLKQEPHLFFLRMGMVQLPPNSACFKPKDPFLWHPIGWWCARDRLSQWNFLNQTP